MNKKDFEWLKEWMPEVVWLMTHEQDKKTFEKAKSVIEVATKRHPPPIEHSPENHATQELGSEDEGKKGQARADKKGDELPES